MISWFLKPLLSLVVHLVRLYATCAYVTEEHKDKINAIEWMKSVCDTELGGGVGGAPDDDSTDLWATCTAVEDIEKVGLCKLNSVA